MAKPKTDSEELNRWLNDRIKESDLTAAEVAEFSRWLRSRSCDHPDEGHRNSTVSFSDVLELVSWMKIRMKDLIVQDVERRELCRWLKEKLSAHSCLTEEELRSVHSELSNKP